MKKLLAVFITIAMVLSLTACGNTNKPGTSDIPGLEDGVFTVAMECAYAPYNWAQPTNANNAVKIKDSALYANGYDVMTAQEICDKYGWKLEVVQLEWDSLIPAVQSGVVDAVIAGQSMTSERMEQVDFAGPYLYASIVCLTRKDSAYAKAKGIGDLAGASCTSQIGTIWYDTCLPQIEGADIRSAAENAPAMLMAVASGAVDFVCTDMPTAQGAVLAYPELTILDFSGTDGDFSVSEEEINIGISVKKGNTALLNAVNDVLKGQTASDFNKLMEKAISIAPLNE